MTIRPPVRTGSAAAPAVLAGVDTDAGAAEAAIAGALESASGSFRAQATALAAHSAKTARGAKLRANDGGLRAFMRS
jgi:hypothetical protein